VLVAVVYSTYTLIRHQFGAACLDDGSRSTALGNAVGSSTSSVRCGSSAM